jgi:hypothetical protein
MDYLDLKKQLHNRILLFTGYVLIAVAIVFAAIALLYQASGVGIDKNGKVIQNGLVLISSKPSGSDIYLNGTLYKDKTNTRLFVPVGDYDVQIKRNGYHSWRRTIDVNGSVVQHFSYPFLIPNKLTTSIIQPYAAAPGLSTQSPDRRWLVTQRTASLTDFDIYDLKDFSKLAVPASLPATLLAPATGAQNLQAVSWADDNRHVLLLHTYDDKTEYILFDRSSPADSVNLNTTLKISPTQLTLQDRKFDKYYIYSATESTVRSLTLNNATPLLRLEHVLAFQSYKDDTFLYVTNAGAKKGEVLVKLLIADKSYTIRSLPADTTYVLDMAGYSGKFYVVAGATSENKVFIYTDPVGQMSRLNIPLPVQPKVLAIANPNYLHFSDTAQFVMAENGNQFAVYDLESLDTFTYAASSPLDVPQTHASWMDGDRIIYVSGGKLVMFDYDHLNQQVLTANNPAYLPYFDPDFAFVAQLATDPTTGKTNLTRTSLRTPADQ